MLLAARVAQGVGGAEMTTEVISWGFVLGCLAMAGLAAMAIGLGIWHRA